MKTTNKIQDNYMIAKALLETLRDEEKELERKYISENNITNDDGSIPERIYCIDNDELFEKANAEQAAIVEKSGLWGNILAAESALEFAEVKLIEYGLSIAPIKEREILSKAVKENYTTRVKIIDLALRLDVSTVR